MVLSGALERERPRGTYECDRNNVASFDALADHLETEDVGVCIAEGDVECMNFLVFMEAFEKGSSFDIPQRRCWNHVLGWRKWGLSASMHRGGGVRGIRERCDA